MHAALQIQQRLITQQIPLARSLFQLQAKHLQTASAVTTHRGLGALQIGGSTLTGAKPEQGIQGSEQLN